VLWKCHGRAYVDFANSRRQLDNPQGSVGGVGGPVPERTAAVTRRAAIDAIARYPVWTTGVMVMAASTKPGAGAAFVVSGHRDRPCPGV
jgi:hypothetical protein